jgi:hypothetical protein
MKNGRLFHSLILWKDLVRASKQGSMAARGVWQQQQSSEIDGDASKKRCASSRRSSQIPRSGRVIRNRMSHKRRHPMWTNLQWIPNQCPPNPPPPKEFMTHLRQKVMLGLRNKVMRAPNQSINQSTPSRNGGASSSRTPRECNWIPSAIWTYYEIFGPKFAWI